jgi:hypothetical protein
MGGKETHDTNSKPDLPHLHQNKQTRDWAKQSLEAPEYLAKTFDNCTTDKMLCMKSSWCMSTTDKNKVKKSGSRMGQLRWQNM